MCDMLIPLQMPIYINTKKFGAFSLHYFPRSEEHTSELQSHSNLVCRLLLEKKKPVFFMDMPFYKLPSSRTVSRRLFHSVLSLVRLAGTMILSTIVLVFATVYFPVSHACLAR